VAEVELQGGILPRRIFHYSLLSHVFSYGFLSDHKMPASVENIML
jgi:hypothetical protein